MDHMPWYDMFLESFPEAIIVYALGLSLIGYDIKKNFKLIALVAIIQSFSSYIIRSLPIPFGLNTLVQILVTIFFLKIILKLNLRSTIIVIISGLFILSIFETTSVVLFSKFTGIPITIITSDHLLRTVVPYIHFALLTILIYIFNKKNITLTPFLYKLKSKKINISILTSIFILIFGFITMLIYASLLLNKRYPLPFKYKQGFELLNILLFIFTIFNIFSIQKNIKIARTQAIIETQEVYLKNLQDLYTGLRSQRHDFTNQIQVIHGLLGLNKFEAAKEFSTELCQHLANLNKVVQVDDPVLAALLQAKMSFADGNKVNFAIDVKTKLDKLPVTPLEFTKIIGNLLDNAFDATMQLPEDKRQVGFGLRCVNNSCVIEITNTGHFIPQNMLKQIFTGGVTTKEKHTGLGLSIVKKLVENYKGDINVTSNESGTIFTVTLPTKKA